MSLTCWFATEGSPSHGNCDDQPDNSSGYHKANEWKEATSTQAVNRGHKVTMIKVPDEEDDVTYR